MTLPKLLDVEAVRERLIQVFPEGTPNRVYCTREMAAYTVLTMLYAGAIEGADRYIRPAQVRLLTDDQLRKQDDKSRNEWWMNTSTRTNWKPKGDERYAADTREPIRDETLRQGLQPVGAVIELKGLPTTSPRPKYALAERFARLFDPELKEPTLESHRQ